MQQALLTSESPEWYTPECVLERVRYIAPIGLDPCSSGRDTVGARRVFTAADDGLARHWLCNDGEIIYVNPPYGLAIKPWVGKCAAVGGSPHTVVALVPARTDTYWFQHLWKSKAICFWRGRLKFSGHRNSAPFPSAVAIWSANDDHVDAFESAFSDFIMSTPGGGRVVRL